MYLAPSLGFHSSVRHLLYLLGIVWECRGTCPGAIHFLMLQLGKPSIIFPQKYPVPTSWALYINVSTTTEMFITYTRHMGRRHCVSL